ncbi:MAG: sugar phosphate isomerase/epimerase [Chloroflexi bacterium]|nr:sugar phosphate isomerase/epimerase [Chloroflexota bacterium]
MIRIGNAPCSWGTLENQEASPIGFAQMLDELVAAGYTGSELGDWGFMPTNSGALANEFAVRALTLTGAYVPVAFARADAHAEGIARAVKTAQLLAAAADSANPPFVVLADDACKIPERLACAGSIGHREMLDEAGWRTFAAGVEAVARAVRDQTGLRSVFHPHCAGYVETPQEITCFLALTDPDMVGIVFDTGHYLYGSGRSEPADVLDALRRFRSRIWYVHLKDCSLRIAAQARAERWDFLAAVRNGLFCELGQGGVPYPEIVQWLRQTAYDGFITVEQDVLPGMGAPYASAMRSREYLRTLGL